MSRKNGRAKGARRKDPHDYTKMPEKIPDSPENIMRAFCNTPPKKDHEWEYMQESPPKLLQRQEQQQQRT